MAATLAGRSVAPPGLAVARGVRLGIVVVLLVSTFVARLPGAMHDALWQDEIATVHVISEPTLRSTLGQIVARESTPPAYYVIARVVDRAVSGLGPEARTRVVRGLSIAFSFGCTLLTFALALQLLPRWAAALAGLLSSFAAILVAHGYELRAYPLLAVVCVAFALALERAAARPGLGRLAVVSAVVVLGSLTHYFFLFTLAAGALWLLVLSVERSVRARVGAALAIGLIPLAVWSPFWLDQYRHGLYATAPRLTVEGFFEFFPSLFAPRQMVGDLGVAFAVVAALAVLVSSLLLLRRPEGRLCALFVLVPVLSVSAMVWITGERIFHPRNLIGVAPFVAIALAWGCAALPWRRASYAAGCALAILVLGGFLYGEMALGRTPYDRIAEQMIVQGFRNDEPILWFGPYSGIFPVAWYLTADEPASMWPRILVSSPTEETCRAVAVVVRTRTGRRWLDQHRDGILAEATIPSYGDTPLGRRRHDVIVAQLRWSDGVLDRPAWGRARFRFHRADTPAPCLAP